MIPFHIFFLVNQPVYFNAITIANGVRMLIFVAMVVMIIIFANFLTRFIESYRLRLLLSQYRTEDRICIVEVIFIPLEILWLKSENLGFISLTKFIFIFEFVIKCCVLLQAHFLNTI